MTQTDNTPAEERQGAENQTKDTIFLDNKQLLDASLETVRQEISMCNSELEQQKKEQYKIKSCQTILDELLKQIHTVNFREIAGLEADEKITRKLYLVIATEKILSIAIANNWGLCTKNGFIYVYNGAY